MDGPNTLKEWNELLDYLQTNIALRKGKFINYNFHDSTLLPPLSTIQQDVLDYLKSNKSPGPLNFSNHFIKLLSSHLSPILCRLINRSYKESCMPSCLKIGKQQTPILKGGDNLIANYRPITGSQQYS